MSTGQDIFTKSKSIKKKRENYDWNKIQLCSEKMTSSSKAR